MELLEKLTKYLEENLSQTYPSITPVLPAGKEGIAISIGPSKKGKRFFDGTVSDNMLLVVTARSMEAEKAFNAVSDILALLESCPKEAIISSNGAFLFERAEIYTNTNFVAIDKGQAYVYTGLVNVVYIRG